MKLSDLVNQFKLNRRKTISEPGAPDHARQHSRAA